MTTFPEDDINRLRIALARISRQVQRRVSDDQMTPTQLSVLGTLARTTRIGMSELADVEGLNPTMLSRIVGKLETAGLVRRAPDAGDRRVIVVEVTAEGTQLHARLRAQRTALFAAHLAHLPGDQAADLLTAIPALESLAAGLYPNDRLAERVSEATAAPAGARA